MGIKIFVNGGATFNPIPVPVKIIGSSTEALFVGPTVAIGTLVVDTVTPQVSSNANVAGTFALRIDNLNAAGVAALEILTANTQAVTISATAVAGVPSQVDIQTSGTWPLNLGYNSLVKIAIAATVQIIVPLSVGAGSGSPTYALQVAPISGITAGQTVFFQDATPVSGATKVIIKAGAGQGSTDLLELQSNAGAVVAIFDVSGNLDIVGRLDVGTFLTVGAASVLGWNGGSLMGSPSDGVIRLSNFAVSDFSLLQFGGTTSSFPALKRAATVLQARLADDSNFAPLQGLLRTAVNAVTGLTPGVLAATTDASIVITDASGQAYRVPCVI